MGILKTHRYLTGGDVQLRLNKTVVRYQDRPVYVGQNLNFPANGDNDVLLDVFDMQTQKYLPERIHSSDEDLEIKAQPLGYYNFKYNTPFGEEHTANYAARMPCRRQRQGLSTENCFVFDVDNKRTDNISPNHLKSKEFASMLMDNYPTFEECLAAFKNSRVKARAFGRKLLIRIDEIGCFKLHYFNTAIGIWNPKRNCFALPERFSHYLGIMRSHGVNCEIFE